MRTDNGRLHPFLQGQADYLGAAAMPGRLFGLENYPAAVIGHANSPQRVLGEAYRLHDSKWLLQILDEYEECAPHFPAPHEYRRHKTTITLSDKRSLRAWVYLYNRPLAGLEPIVGGDYRQHIKTR